MKKAVAYILGFLKIPNLPAGEADPSQSLYIRSLQYASRLDYLPWRRSSRYCNKLPQKTLRVPTIQSISLLSITIYLSHLAIRFRFLFTKASTQHTLMSSNSVHSTNTTDVAVTHHRLYQPPAYQPSAGQPRPVGQHFQPRPHHSGR